MMDTSELLSSKENIQPLRHGRDTSKLCAALQAQTDNDTGRALEKQREEYETLLRDDTIADPLAVWYDYVNWLEQCFPSQNKKGNINTVLKKCISKLKNVEHYKNDERFVKLCLKYVTMSDNTTELFTSLYSHGIGIKCAVFYIAWAELYVMCNSFGKADKIYEKGINLLAEPMPMLKAAKRKFEEYMVKKIKSGEKFEPTSEVYETGTVRHAYNKINVLQVGSKQVVPSERIGNNVAAPGKYSSAKPAVLKGPIAIYTDDDDGIDVQPTAKLNKVPSQKAMTKENHKKAGTWTNSKKNVPFAVPPSSLPFQVHKDEDDSSTPKPTNLLSSALKPKQSNDEFNVDYSKTPLFWAEPYDPLIKPMYCKEQVYAGGLEFQFEELRAIKYRRKLEEATDSNLETPHAYLKKKPIMTPQLHNPDPSIPHVENSRVAVSNQESVKSVLAQTSRPQDESGRKILIKKPDESNSKPRIVNDSGRKSFKIKTSEETRSARRKIALGGDESDRRGSARKSVHSNFAGVVRRTLVMDSHGSDVIPKMDVPSDSFINQTIHTKEAVNEMQQLWFAKPVTPPPQEKVAAPPPFAFYVDESCLGKEAVEAETKPASNAVEGAKGDFRKSSLVDLNDHNKENSVPINYAGSTGKSTRPVTGILTLADNVPFDPIQEDDEQTDNEETSIPEGPGNTTGITETWNFTQAFSFPKIIHASTPNCRRFHAPSDEPLKIPEKPTFDNSDDELVDMKIQAAAHEKKSKSNSEQVEPTKILTRNLQAEQRTLGDVGGKNLSIIVETSREYKSSSSGSGASACSKFLPFTPGESRSEAYVKRYHEESRKTPFAFKSHMTNGYEASAELSCTAMKSCGDGLNLKFDPHENEVNAVNGAQLKNVENNETDAINKVKSVLENLSLKDTPCPKLTVQNVTDVIAENAIIEDVDPFDDKVIDNFLEKMNFPAANHADGCFFVHSKLAPLKLNSHISLDNESFDIKKVLGEGAYAKIFKAQSKKSNEIKVIKYQKPAFPWEFYIAREIQARCVDKNLASYFMAIHQGYFYENASLLISSPVDYGDLLTAINLYKVNQGKPMSDFLALYFTVQILDIIGTLHSLQIIHGDVKPDNFLVKEVNGKLTLELIDFGRSIDMTLFSAKTTFTKVVTTDTFTCVEMLTGRPWTYQIDLFGIAGCVHCLLFGDYMKVTEKAGIWGITKVIPRYLAKSGWKGLFESLLNIPSCTDLPNLSELRNDLHSKLTAYGPHHDLGKLTNFLQNR